MFKKASDYKNEKLSIVVFGEPNTGKTSLVRTIKDKALIIDAERGLQSINDLDVPVFQLFKDSKGNDVPRTQRFERLVGFLDYLKSGKVEEKFDWIVIDSITEISQNLVEELTEKHKAETNRFALWGEYNEKITKLLKDLRDIEGYNVLCLALVDESKNEDGSKDKTLDLQGKISQRLPAIFDEVFYLNRNNDGERVLVTDNYKNIICKDRSGKLEKFEQANIQLIADKIKGKKQPIKKEGN